MPYNVPEDAWQNYLLRFDAEEGCGFQECDVEDTEHFHCKDEGCETVFRTEEGVREHGKNHFQQDQISETFFAKVDPEEPGSESGCPTSCQYRGKEIHFHCKIVSSFPISPVITFDNGSVIIYGLFKHPALFCPKLCAPVQLLKPIPERSNLHCTWSRAAVDEAKIFLNQAEAAQCST